MDRVEPLPVIHAASAELGSQSRPGWLVEHLWAAEGVGVIGGAPKCCKTWLSLDLAVSVASGTDALGRFHVQAPGPVLVYGSEDAPVALRDRIETIARARGLGLAELDLALIVVETLRLDAARDRARLRATLQQRAPRLLILDPLVRLHRIDENSAGEMSALLGELRALQREHHVAIALVHHVRKNGSPRGQDGQSLRGSGDVHPGETATFTCAAATGRSRSPSSINPRRPRRRAYSNSRTAPTCIYASSTAVPSNATWRSMRPTGLSRCCRLAP